MRACRAELKRPISPQVALLAAGDARGARGPLKDTPQLVSSLNSLLLARRHKQWLHPATTSPLSPQRQRSGQPVVAAAVPRV